jgi:hypothetical protein
MGLNLMDSNDFISQVQQ